MNILYLYGFKFVNKLDIPLIIFATRTNLVV